MTDYYQLLQVDPAADDDIIRAAYQRIISKLHPDKNPDPDAQRRAQEVNEAYRILGDPALRAQYDGQRPPASSAQADLRREVDLRLEERRRREEAEEALALAREEAARARQQARDEAQAAQARLESLMRQLEEEEYRRHEAEARRAALEQAEARRRGFGLGEAGRRAMGRAGRLAWFGGGGLSAAAAMFLYGHISLPAGSQPLEPEMVFVKGGCYDMGSPDEEPERTRYEGPRHQACFKGFNLGKHEVTFEEYDRFARATGRYLPDDNGWGRGRRPAINVSWEDASAYAQWLGQQTGQRYRLPTEAEWEYAARAGADTVFPNGECIGTGFANYDGRSDYFHCGARTGVYLGKTQPVGTYLPSRWGLHDMPGNVWEWVADCWHDSYEGAPGRGAAWGGPDESCESRVVRGGAWDSGPNWLRPAYRGHWGAGRQYADVGFRLARD